MTEENVSLVRSYNDAMSFSREYAMTRYGDRADMAVRAAEALVKIQAGAELGFGPMASISAFHVINDKPTMSGIAWAAKVRLSGRYDYRIVKSNSTECELMFLDAGSDAYLSVFTLDDAKRAGLLGNNTWKKYPEDMLFNRAMTKGARKVCPEIGMGMGIYTPEELRGNEVDLYDEPPVKRGMAKNHIHEYGIEELGEVIKASGFEVCKRFGTFASYPAIKAAMTDTDLDVYERVRSFYGDEVAACFMAPLYPDASRNNAWLLRRAGDN